MEAMFYKHGERVSTGRAYGECSERSTFMVREHWYMVVADTWLSMGDETILMRMAKLLYRSYGVRY